jgi:hypothetical protein
MNEAGRCRPASGCEIPDALRGGFHSYGEETRSHLSDERLWEVTRTQHQQHLSPSLDFMQASSYPSGQLRLMSFIVDPPVVQASNRTRKPGSSCVHRKSITYLIRRVDNRSQTQSTSLNPSGNLLRDFVRARALAPSPATRCARVAPVMGMWHRIWRAVEDPLR